MGSSDATRDVRKSYFDVLGLCCSSEVPLIEKILKQLDGIKEVSVIVPTRTVIVVHDNLLISQIQIVKALNQARLEANIRVYGEPTHRMKWPSPYTVGCGILLIISFFKSFYHPLQWFAVAAVIVGLAPIGLRSIAAIRNVTLDINILILIAVGGSIALGDYLEAGTIVFLFTIAEWLESKASHKATAAMTSLLTMAPQQAILADSGLTVDAKDVKLNTILAVKSGEVIPIDGIVVEGMCEVDEKTLTGESFPVSKQKDNNVWAGTMNLNGYITVKTTALAEDCVVAKMAMLVEEAQNNKSKTQRLIDDCTKYYTPVVVLVAITLAVIPAALKLHNLNRWFHLALVVLVSACPCALILSTPVATFCTLTKAAANGVLIKGGDYLEIMGKIKIMAFDKTGTITRGEFVVTDFQTVSQDTSLDTLLYWVSSIESKSSHPMAAALVGYGRSNLIEPIAENVTKFENFPGEGIYGEIDGKNIFIGNKKIARRAGCETAPVEGSDTKGGATVGYIFLEGNLVGIFSLADTCRSGVVDAIIELKNMSIRTVMLTGDSNAAANHAQEQLGHAIEVVHAELLPEDKASIIKNLKEEQPTAMIGDGINDAPALATADVGISMGISGSALATETGHVTLMSNDIRKIPQAIKLARKSRRKVIENVIISISTKVAVLALACSGHPLLWAAVLVDVGTCLFVTLNSMLLLRGTSGTKSSSPSHAHKHKSEGGCGEHKRVACKSSNKHKSEGGCGEHKRVACKSSNCSHSAPPIHEHCCSHEVPHCESSTSVVSCGSENPSPNCSESDHTSSITCQRSDHNHAPESKFEAGEVENGGSGNSTDLSTTLDHVEEEHVAVSSGLSHCESIESHACMSLEKREIGGCCRSFRKECEGKHGCLGAKLGGLSEIIIE